MKKSVTWLHLSDLHFGKSQFEQEFSATKLLMHLSEKKSMGIEPDFVFITGDIANSGKEKEYEEFSRNIIFPLMDMFGGDFLDKIFIVPGNHDLNRDVHDAFSKQKLLRPDSDCFHPTQQGRNRRAMVVERFSSFCNSVPSSGVKEFEGESGAFSFLQEVNGHRIGIVGLNTAWLCDGDADRENLTPGIQLARSAIDKCEQADVRFVLGHHPLDWMNSGHSPTIISIFGAANVIYLHGHLHAENHNMFLTGSGEFVAIQAGAAWQAPEGGKWKNGFVWGTLDDTLTKISIQPYFWSFENQCWTLDGSRFHENYRNGDWWDFDAPRKKNNRIEQEAKKKKSPLVSWDVKDFDSLEALSAPLSPTEAIAYFDGATPTWRTALSNSIPRREIVGKITSHCNVNSDLPIVTVLLAAGCEGKTTALLQASLEILRNDSRKKVLFRTNHTRPFDVDELAETLHSHPNWLIVIDEADQVAEDILRFVENRISDFDGRIDFLLASRDSDWHSSGANNLTWRFKSKFKDIFLKDLNARDAGLIVKAWEKYGKEGLGPELELLSSDERADKLRYYAKIEAKGRADAFFGALLMCRHGGDLLEHAEAMLERLSKVELDCGKSLKDILGYIAAMHAEGFEKLTFSALAAITKMTVPKLQNEVIRQLGKEAAATSTSTSIFTRHKRIAEAIIEVLENKFDEDISNYFIELANSEVNRSKTEKVIDLVFWRFDLGEKLFSSGKTRLGIQIAESLYEADDTNVHLLTKLASFYRRLGSPSAAIELFRAFPYVPKHRAFYFEWGVCEGKERHYLENALLAIFALSDDSENRSISVDEAKMITTGLSQCFNKLHITFADPSFRKAEDSCNSLLCILIGKKSRQEELGINLDAFLKDVAKKSRSFYGRSESIQLIREALLKFQNYGVDADIAQKIIPTTFVYYDSIVRNMELFKKETEGTV